MSSKNSVIPSHMTITLTLLIILTSTPVVPGAMYLSLEPLEGKPAMKDREAALILLPQRGVSNGDYEVFCRLVQDLYPLRLWVGLADISHETELSMETLTILLIEAQNELHYAGMSTNVDVFLVAHGSTGQAVAAYARAVPERLKGLILLGSSLPNNAGGPLAFPLPVLTLVGELDGVAKITSIAHALQDMMLSDSFNLDHVMRNPLVILEGSNHEVFITSGLPDSLHQLDIEAEKQKSVGMESAAHKTAVFLASVLKEPEDLSGQAHSEFKLAFEKAVNITEPILTLRSMTHDVKTGKSYWVRSAQKWLSGLEGKESTQLAVDSFVVADRTNMALPPTLVKDGGIDTVVTFSDVIRYQANGESEGGVVHAPDEIAARMLGPHRIQDQLNTEIRENYTCRDLNYAAYMTAYHTASPAARDRYDRYHRGMTFSPDLVTDSHVMWETTPLKTHVTDGEMHVTSMSFKTDKDFAEQEFAGVFYCKLLPPDKALEWILVDSLRRNM